MNLFCFGYGYTCDYIAHALSHEKQIAGDWKTSGTTRDPEKRESLIQRGIEAYIFDYEHPLPDPPQTLEGITHLLISTPASGDGDPVFNMHAEDILKIKSLKWVGYLSTTNVYGDREGEWVDESSELRPSTKRGSRRKQAEEQWQSLLKTHNLPLHIFRLSGIYGPGRSALDSVRAGMARRINKPGHVFSRTHVEDIAQTICASMANPNPGAIYNICDDEAAPSHEIISYACELLNRIPPDMIDFDLADLAPITRSFYCDNKHVHNDRIKEELGINLKYKNYREGLRGCLAAEQYALAQIKEKETGTEQKVPKIFS